MSSVDPFTPTPTFFEVLGSIAQNLSADRDEADNLTRCLKTLVESSQAAQGVGLLQGAAGLTAVAEYGTLDENTRLAHFTLARLCLETGQAVAEIQGEGWLAATPLVGLEEIFEAIASGAAGEARRAAELEEVLQLALQRLPEKSRTALLLLQQQHMDYTAAAATLRMSENALRVLVHRARQLLKTEMEAQS